MILRAWCAHYMTEYDRRFSHTSPTMGAVTSTRDFRRSGTKGHSLVIFSNSAMVCCVYRFEMLLRYSIRNVATRSAEYERLRKLYDNAFREWIEASRSHDFRTGHPAPDTETEAQARMAAARALVRQRRDALAAFLSSSNQVNAPYAQVEHAAYFIWLNAGRPSGTAAADWFCAQKQLTGV